MKILIHWIVSVTNDFFIELLYVIYCPLLIEFNWFVSDEIGKKKKSQPEIKLFEDNTDDGKSGFNTIIQLETGGRKNSQF